MPKAKNPKTTLYHLNKQMKDRNMGPGTLFKYTYPEGNLYVVTMNTTIDKMGYVKNVNKDAYKLLKVTPGVVMMYLDAIYDPYAGKHYLRFLLREKVVAILFRKGKTFKDFDARFEVLFSNTVSFESKVSK